ncbi:MAG: ATP-binding protein [Acidobacteriota bacterium]|nr:ATP-binding protein [Acidobacteriota bacterium]
MDPTRNPYSPGAGSPPPALVGRDAELETIRIAIERLRLGRFAKSVILTGLRGVGKTVLLQEFRRLGQSRNWVCQPLEASEGMRFPQAMAELVRKVLLRLSPAQNLADRAKRAFGVLKSFQVRWNLPDGGDLTVGLDPVPGRADSGLLDEDLAGLFSEVGEAARERGKGVLVTVDEVQYLKRKDLAALIVGLHQVNQEQLPFLVVGAGLPSVPALAGEAKSYAERLFNFRSIDSLDGDDARAALVKPADEEGVVWQPDALDRIVDETQGYPYFLQEFGKQVWDLADGPVEITATDVDSAVTTAVDELDTGFFRVRIDRTTDSEREYLVAMASLGEGPYASGRVAATMGRDTPGVGPVRDKLIKKGLCYSPRWGEIDFTVPLFDDFVRRRLCAPGDVRSS